MSVILVTEKRLEERGGIESMTKVLALNLAKSNTPVYLVHRSLFRIVGVLQGSSLLAYSNPSRGGRESVKAIRVGEIIYVLSNVIFSLFAALATISLVKRTRASGHLVILHALDTTYSGLAALLASRLMAVDYVVHTHGIRSHYVHLTSRSNLTKSLDFLLENLVVRHSAVLISVNEQAREFWIKRGIAPDKVVAIRVPVRTNLYAPCIEKRMLVRNRLNIDEKSFVFGYLGRLAPEKNVQILMEAFGRYRMGTKLMIVGDGPLMRKLVDYAKSTGIADSVIFTGFRSDVPDIINSFDVLVLPSLIEGMPTVILESFCNGKTVIASDIPANREFVTHGKNGLLFNPRDFLELRDAMQEIHSNMAYRSRLQAQARIDAAKYDEEVILSEIRRLYRVILARHV